MTMFLLYILLIIIILGGAIYTSIIPNHTHKPPESFMGNMRYKRVRIVDNGKESYKLLTNVNPTKNYRISDETQLALNKLKKKCIYKKKIMCTFDSPECLINRYDNKLRCSNIVDNTKNMRCKCNSDCCGNLCKHSICVDTDPNATDTFGYKFMHIKQ